jgi:hypothetical protein
MRRPYRSKIHEKYFRLIDVKAESTLKFFQFERSADSMHGCCIAEFPADQRPERVAGEA